MSESVRRWPAAALLLLSALLFGYAAVRAYEVSFTYDESYTFLQHVRKGVFYQQSFDQMGGNHHLLNVWLMMAARALLGDSELALRLPNLLAYTMYLFASARIALRAAHAILAIGVFLLLNLHPYLLDFFSLARGYGLANGFLLMSLWLGSRFLLEGYKARHLTWATFFAMLAALSHVIMVNYLLAFTGTMGAMMLPLVLREGMRAWRSRYLILALLTMAGLGFILPNALGLFHGNSLNFGCNHLWTCTMRSLAEKVLYHFPYEKAPLVIVEKALWWCVGACTATALLAWRWKALYRLRPMLAGLLVLSLCISSFLLQHALFGVPLPATRTALFLLPIAAFTVASAMLAWQRWQAVPLVATLAGAVLLGSLSVQAFNTVYCIEWRPSAGLRSALELIDRDRAPASPQRPLVNLACGFESGGCVPYYIVVRHMPWLASTVKPLEGPFPQSDYYLVDYDAAQWVDSINWTLLSRFHESGLALYRDERMRQAGRQVLFHGKATPGSWVDGPPAVHYTVPDPPPPAPVIFTGTTSALELSHDNWLGLSLEILRDDSIIESGGQPSHPQIRRYGEWCNLSVEFAPATALRPGDVARFRLVPLHGAWPIPVRSMELWVLR